MGFYGLLAVFYDFQGRFLGDLCSGIAVFCDLIFCKFLLKKPWFLLEVVDFFRTSHAFCSFLKIRFLCHHAYFWFFLLFWCRAQFLKDLSGILLVFENWVSKKLPNKSLFCVFFFWKRAFCLRGPNKIVSLCHCFLRLFIFNRKYKFRWTYQADWPFLTLRNENVSVFFFYQILAIFLINF